MPYVRTNWEDAPSTATPIDASHLNKIEDCLVELTDINAWNFDVLTSTGSGVIYKNGNLCQLVITMNNPIAIGGRSDLIQFPDGFKPAMDFYTQAISDVYGETLGLVAYNRSENRLTLNTSSTETFTAKISFTYILDS